MLINSPISSEREALPLIRAGADMFYMGIDFTSLLGIKNIVSSRWPWKSGNFHRQEDILRTVRTVHAHGKKIYLTLNEHSYIPSVLNKICAWLKDHPLFDGIIAADLAVILALRTAVTIPIIASTGLNVFSQADVDLFRAQGLTTMILPRTLNITEIKDIVQRNTDIRFEFLIYNHDCYFIDGLCRFLHGIHKGHGCKGLCAGALQEPYRSRLPLLEDDHLAYLWDLNKLGIDSVKIVGRINTITKKTQDVILLRRLIDSLPATRKAYLALLSKARPRTYQ